MQTGEGFATHIGQYTFVNTSNIFDFSDEFEGVIVAENGDEIHYDSALIECEENIPAPDFCPGVNATFTYTIYGGTGLFQGAEGTITIKGEFVAGGPFEARGWAEFTYLSIP